MTEHYTVLTDKGASKIAEAIRIGQQLEITQMALGDGDGKLPQPQSNATSLIKEHYRAPINSAKVDEHNNAWVIFEQVLAPDVGGWWIREVGLYDKDGDLIAIGNYPEQYKPLLTEGASTTQTVTIVIQVLSSEAITLKVDPSVVLATRQYVDEALKSANSSIDQIFSSIRKNILIEDPERIGLRNSHGDTLWIDSSNSLSFQTNQGKEKFAVHDGVIDVGTIGAKQIDGLGNAALADIWDDAKATWYEELPWGSGAVVSSGGLRNIFSGTVSGVAGKWTSPANYNNLAGNPKELLTTQQFVEYRNDARTPGAINSYVMAIQFSGSDANLGDYRQGSELMPAPCNGMGHLPQQSRLQGTWRCAGQAEKNDQLNAYQPFRTTIWVRVS